MAVQQGARDAGAAALVLVVVAVGAAIQLLGAQAPGGQPGAPFDEVYERARQANASLTTLTAQFTESTTSSLLSRPLVSHGTIAVQRPSRIILRYTDPDRRILLIDGDRMTTAWPGRQLRQEFDIRRSQARVQRYFVDGGAAELRREFDLEQSAASERPGTHEIRLRPKRRQIRETLTRLELWVDRKTSLLEAMRMTFANADTKTMTFDHVVANPTLATDAFSVDR